MNRTGASLLAAAVLIFGSLVTSTPAFAAPTDEPTPPGYPSRSGLVTSSNGASNAQLAPMGTSPAGCYGQTDFAHRSGDESSVHGRTKCAWPVTTVSVTTRLYHHAWFGWNQLDSRTQTKSGTTKTPDATPHYGCSSTAENDFYGSSSHYSVESGTTYIASTASSVKSFVC